MGSGRGDRNQALNVTRFLHAFEPLQWGPVVVTGIREPAMTAEDPPRMLQWGPVVVTGIREPAMTAEDPPRMLQWGPVVVTGISGAGLERTAAAMGLLQ